MSHATTSNITKGEGHPYVIGHFGEHLVLNWLSRSGFRVALIDHEAIDIIACHPKSNQRLGISVKSRTRKPGTENDPVRIFDSRKPKQKRKQLLDVCNAFKFKPWIAVYAEYESGADLYMTTLDHYERCYRSKKAKGAEWSMSLKRRKEYEKDKRVKHLYIEFHRKHWF